MIGIKYVYYCYFFKVEFFGYYLCVYKDIGMAFFEIINKLGVGMFVVYCVEVYVCYVCFW